MHTKIILPFLLSFFAMIPMTFAADSAAVEKSIQSQLIKHYSAIEKSNTYEEKLTQFQRLLDLIYTEHKKYSDSVYELTAVINQPDGADKTQFIEDLKAEQVHLEKWSAVQKAFEIPSIFFSEANEFDFNCEAIEDEILSTFEPAKKEVSSSALIRFSINLSLKVSEDLCKLKLE